MLRSEPMSSWTRSWPLGVAVRLPDGFLSHSVPEHLGRWSVGRSAVRSVMKFESQCLRFRTQKLLCMHEPSVCTERSVRPSLHLAARKVSSHTGKLLQLPGQIITTAINYGQSDTALTLYRHQRWLISTATKNKETCLACSSGNTSDLCLEDALFECGAVG